MEFNNCNKLIADILKDHGRQLSDSGYDKVILSFLDSKSRYMERLKMKLLESHDLSISMSCKCVDFQMGVSGLFRNSSDLVHFQFEYQYDAGQGDLIVPKITARLGDTRLDFVPEQGKVLPSANFIYDELAKHPVQQVSDIRPGEQIIKLHR